MSVLDVFGFLTRWKARLAEPAALLESELLPGERVLWLGPSTARTVYAVTDRRIIALARFSSEPVTWIGRGELSDVQLRLRADGTGDVMFRRDPTNLEQLMVYWGNPNEDEDARALVRAAAITFLGIPEPREVVDLVRREFRLGEGS